MPEIELDDAATAKTLIEHMSDELAAERHRYDLFLACDFAKSLLLFAARQAKKHQELVLKSLSPRDQANFEAWEQLASGTFLRRALDWRLACIREEYAAVQSIIDAQAQGAAGKSDRHGNALGEYGLYQSPRIDPASPQSAGS